MSNYSAFNRTPPRPSYDGDVAAIDAGLRQYMLRVYNFMAAGLGLTGVVAYGSVATGFYQQIAGTPLISDFQVAFTCLISASGSGT